MPTTALLAAASVYKSVGYIFAVIVIGGVRQATVSKLESGEPATQLRILMDALAALDLELVVRPRTSARSSDIEDLF